MMMMMAYDPTPPDDLLDEETITAVRIALLAYVDAPAEGAALRRALRAMATEAHRKSIRPEQLLVVLKDIWYALPSVRESTAEMDQVRLLQRAVTMCIKEYYGD
jgi:hypothetical protein